MANRSSRGLVTKVAALFTIMFLISMIEQISAQTGAANCTAVGGQCLSGGDCCSTHCNRPSERGRRKRKSKKPNPNPVHGTCYVPCIKSGKPCEVDSECCSSTCNLATDVEPIRKCLTPCNGQDQVCTANSQCCSGNCGLQAVSSLLRDLLTIGTCSPTSCTPLSKRCKVDSECCSGKCQRFIGDDGQCITGVQI